MSLGRKSLPFLISLAIHVLGLGVVLWGGLHWRNTLSVEPGRSSLRMIAVQAPSPVPPTPPAPVRPTKAEISTPAKVPQPARDETKPVPASTPENGALTPSRPDALRNAPPAYPESARQRGIEGTVTLLVRVGRDGVVRDISVSKGSGSSALDEAALEAVRRWHFHPASLGSLPVESFVEVPIRFQLDR